MPISQSPHPNSAHVRETRPTRAGKEPARAAEPRSPLLLILALAAGLRLYGLGEESLWGDEGLTINRILGTSYGGFLHRGPLETQGPLYYLLNKAWCDAFGLSVEALRFPSAIFGVLGVLTIYHLGRTMFDRRAGLLAALFLAVNPFALHYSQEARPYSLFMLTGVASAYFMVRLMGQFRLGDALGYVVATLAALDARAPVEAVIQLNDQLDVNTLAHHVARITILRRAVASRTPPNRP